MGGRALRAWLLQPLLDRAAIEARLDAVAALLDASILRQELRETLKGVLDLERLAGKNRFGRRASARFRRAQAVPAVFARDP